MKLVIALLVLLGVNIGFVLGCWWAAEHKLVIETRKPGDAAAPSVPLRRAPSPSRRQST